MTATKFAKPWRHGNPGPSQCEGETLSKWETAILGKYENDKFMEL